MSNYRRSDKPRAETPSPEVASNFSEIANRATTRRKFLKHISFGTSAFIMSTASNSGVARKHLEFNPVAANGLDTITVPEGYQWYVTSSIQVPGNTVDVNNDAIDVITTGRHDPCVGIRAVPIAEAMLALTLMDHAVRDRAQNYKS